MLCVRLQDEFKQLQVRLNEEFGEQEWVAANLNIIQIPFETRQALDTYKAGTTYQQVYVHRLTVGQNQATRPQTQSCAVSRSTSAAAYLKRRKCFSAIF